LTTTYKIKEARIDDADYTPYGGALNLVRYKGSEAIVSGQQRREKLSLLYGSFIFALASILMLLLLLSGKP